MQRRRQRTYGWVVVLGFLAATSLARPSVAEASADPGAKLFKEKLCVTCHGADGTTALAPTYPKLAGQYPEYLIAQTKDILSGKRNNGQTALMKATLTALKLTDDEIKTIATWLSKKK